MREETISDNFRVRLDKMGGEESVSVVVFTGLADYENLEKYLEKQQIPYKKIGILPSVELTARKKDIYDLAGQPYVTAILENQELKPL